MILSRLRLTRAYRASLWMALWAMLLPVLIPLVHRPATASPVSTPICHTVINGSVNKPAPDQKARTSCPICQGLNNLAQGFVPPETPSLMTVPSASVVKAEQGQYFIIRSVATAAWPRAPPSLA
jgi:hypothetical protein